MSHCPQCGRANPIEGAVACPYCGARPAALGAPPKAARTIAGVSLEDMALRSAPPAGVASKASRTIVGMPADALDRGEPALSTKTQVAGTPAAASRTIVGMTASDVAIASAAPGVRPGPIAGAPRAAPAASHTLLGVARPGIAPLRPGESPELDEPGDAAVFASNDDRPYEPFADNATPYGYEPANELGATVGPGAFGLAPPMERAPAWEGGKRRHRIEAPRGGAWSPKRAADPATKRALAVVIAAGALALIAVLVAVFWPSPPPLTARARADAEGREGVELRCPSCPDGTKVSINGASAVMTGGAAILPLATTLSLGENRMKVVVDRPGSGRDETLGVVVNVAYRIRPDLTALQSEHPSIQIVAEAAAGTTVSINGHVLALAGGHAVETLDVTEACTGLSGESKTLSRQIPYVVTPDGAPAENGVLNVSVGIASLQLEAPGPHVIIDGSSFVLAGRTMKGAEVLAAGRPIAVRADGTFAQVMNVSSVGATQIEVRARIPGLAPRLAQIKVRRVESLEAAAREFMAASPIGYSALAGDVAAQAGKPIALTGEVTDTRKQGYETVMLLDVAQSSGCSTSGACPVRLVVGAESAAKKGDTLRIFGHVTRAVALPGRADVPEIEVDFALSGGKGAPTSNGKGGK